MPIEERWLAELKLAERRPALAKASARQAGAAERKPPIPPYDIEIM